MTDTWDNAAFDAVDAIYRTTTGPTRLADVRWRLDEFIDAEFRADLTTPSTANFWLGLGSAVERLARDHYPDARKYLTFYDVHALLVKKQRDYGHENILRFGRDGLLVRVHDKVARLENLAARGAEPENEAVLDTLADLIGYSAIGVMVANGTFILPLAEDVTSDSFVTFLADRWGEPFPRTTDAADLAAVKRLEGVNTDEYGFIVRDEHGTYGIVVEWEFEWHHSDKCGITGSMPEWWEAFTEQQAIAGVEAWAAAVAAKVSRPIRVATIVNSDDVFANRLGVHFFVPETDLDLVPEVLDAAREVSIHDLTAGA